MKQNLSYLSNIWFDSNRFYFLSFQKIKKVIKKNKNYIYFGQEKFKLLFEKLVICSEYGIILSGLIAGGPITTPFLNYYYVIELHNRVTYFL